MPIRKQPYDVCGAAAKEERRGKMTSYLAEMMSLI